MPQCFSVVTISLLSLTLLAVSCSKYLSVSKERPFDMFADRVFSQTAAGILTLPGSKLVLC